MPNTIKRALTKIKEENEENEKNKKLLLPIIKNRPKSNYIFNKNKKVENENKDSDLFINQLKSMLKNRDKELTSQYYTNYGFDLNKKYQRVYEILFGKNTKFLPF